MLWTAPSRERAERRKANLFYIQQHLAADLVADARAFLHCGTHGEDRARALRARAKQNSGSSRWLAASRKVVDPAWDGNARVGYMVTTPGVDLEKKKGKGLREWASERMARALFGGRDPREAKTAEATWSRLNKLLSEIAPGYDGKMFKGCHLSSDLLARYSRNVDLCVVAALQRYCLVMPGAEYPCAIRDWPWDAERMDRWVLAHKEKQAADGTGMARAMPEKARAKPAMARAMPTGEPPKKITRREPRASTGAAAASSASGAPRSSGSAAAPPGSAEPPLPPPALPPPAAVPCSLYSKWGEVP